MARLKRAPPRGLIKSPAKPGLDLTHLRYEVDAPLDQHIEHFWSVAWKLPKGVTHAASSLPHPSIHVVWEADEVRVVGVVTGRFTREMHGESRAFAAKFHPGAFRAILGAPVSSITDSTIPLSEVLGAKKARSYRDALANAPDDDARVKFATEFWNALMPAPAHDASLLAQLVKAATEDRTITSVEQLRARAGMHLRELQRWFDDAVGITPKWMIQRYRLHAALSELERGRQPLTHLAQSLGYADQAHFARDFKALTGVSPSRYVRSLAPGGRHVV